MKTRVRFRSSKFPAYEGEEIDVNPGLWGRRLTEYLVANLTARGIIFGAPAREDWGYYLPVKCDGVTIALCCGLQSGADDEFLCFTDPPSPTLKRLFRKVDITPQLTRVLDSLRVQLESDSDILGIVWEAPS